MTRQDHILDIIPRMPTRIARLEELADNLWYSWHRPARTLFLTIDPELWNRVSHNPKLFLKRVGQNRLDQAASDPVFLEHYHAVLSAFDTYREKLAPGNDYGLATDDLIVYMCAEFGLHESLPIYSGGLGILAGHHCKTASDLSLPFIAVGLLYRAGYFTQHIDADGNQIAHFVESRFDDLPMHRVDDSDGQPLEIQVPFPHGDVYAHIWAVHSGNANVYLLDTDIAANNVQDQEITYQLYGGNTETRIKQEMILGIGGVRALRKLGIAPTVWHMNEGHPAFSILERVREKTAAGLDFDSALECVAANTVFTTHTPVPAGHDIFNREQVLDYLAPMIDALGASADQLLDLGRLRDSDMDFNMTTLALKGSRHHNGVSKIHGDVSATICAPRWPQVPPDENPMSYVTNGVHVSTVLVQDWIDLFDRMLGAQWRNHLSDRPFWEQVHEIPDHLFWSVKQAIKSRMLAELRAVLRIQYLRNQFSEPHIERLLHHIDPKDPNVLTIGFARRFATYKRATLFANNLDWLEQIVTHTERPVVFVIAGKAHPADAPGQALLKRVHELSMMPKLASKILLVEGYDLALARLLVAGVDVWLNNPVYTMEASGTSGMKAAMNATLNLSVTDGWWAEGFEGDNGWAIRPSPHLEDDARRDTEDARTFYELLQDDIVPLYYERNEYGHSPEWIAMAKRSIVSVLPRFNMNRVVEQYARSYYLPAAKFGRARRRDNAAQARELAAWKRRVATCWHDVSLREVGERPNALAAGEVLVIDMAVDLRDLEPNDVVLELRLARLLSRPQVGNGLLSNHYIADTPEQEQDIHWQSYPFQAIRQEDENGDWLYRLELQPEDCGRLRFEIRLYPFHDALVHPHETGFMMWH